MSSAKTCRSEQHLRHLVVPGQVIATASEGADGSGGFLRGHGTYIEGLATIRDPPLGASAGTASGRKRGSVNDGSDDENYMITSDNDEDDDITPAIDTSNQRLIASVCGTVERVNKLISVIPFSSMSYNGNVGDLVVGRISSVGGNRWKVHLGYGLRDAHLPLSGVNLPGGVQRIRTAEDALGMRTLFTEGDLVSAEVQQVGHTDGVLSLHTRSLRYGKLENGCLIIVHPALIKRMKQHFATLPSYVGVDVLLGTNGFIWIQRTPPKEWQEQLSSTQEELDAPLADTLVKLRKRHASTEVLPDERENISRVRNAVELLKLVYFQITSESIMEVYDASVEHKVEVKDMLLPEMVVKLTESTRRQ